MPLRIRDDRRPRAAVPATGATSLGGRSPLNHHRTRWLAVAAPWLVVLAPAVDAQVSTATKAAQGVQAGTLVIEPKAELYGTTYRLVNIMTCIGNASDPRAYGVKTCETAIGMEPAPIPSKSLPQEETTVPLLDGTLKASPSAPVNNPVVTLYTVAGSPSRLAGDGMNIVSWKNTGPHPVVIGYTVGEHNTTNQHQGVKADTLSPGFEGAPASSYPFAHAKYALCL